MFSSMASNTKPPFIFSSKPRYGPFTAIYYNSDRPTLRELTGKENVLAKYDEKELLKAETYFKMAGKKGTLLLSYIEDESKREALAFKLDFGEDAKAKKRALIGDGKVDPLMKDLVDGVCDFHELLSAVNEVVNQGWRVHYATHARLLARMAERERLVEEMGRLEEKIRCLDEDLIPQDSKILIFSDKVAMKDEPKVRQGRLFANDIMKKLDWYFELCA